MSYKVKLDIFEGPFDLLVYLIESAEMSIYDIRVSEITEQYLTHLEELRSRDLVRGGEFMVLAAELIELKSRMLLPRVKTDGGTPEEDPRSELVHKILEYKKFKAAAIILADQEEAGQRIFEKPGEDLTAYTGEADEYLRMDMDRFVQAFRQFIGRKQRIEEVRKQYERVERQRATVESKIEEIRRLFGMKKVRALSFGQLLHPESDRYDVVLTFVSLLEMIGKKAISVRQQSSFGEITVEIQSWEETGYAQ